MYKLFKNTKETVDFFLEIKSHEIEKSKLNEFNDIYIQNIRKRETEVAIIRDSISYNVRNITIQDALARFEEYDFPLAKAFNIDSNEKNRGFI